MEVSTIPHILPQGETRAAREALFTGFVREYVAIIEASDGLATARPKIVKSLEKAVEALDDAALATALKERQTERSEVVKGALKNDKKAGGFETAMKKLEAMLS